MAFIHGITPGLVPSIDEPTVVQEPKPDTHEDHCALCQGLLVDKALKFAQFHLDDNDCLLCKHCDSAIGSSFFGHGLTNDSLDRIQEKMHKAESGDDWALILRPTSLTSLGGTSFTLERGDMFKIVRIGTKNWPTKSCDGARSKSAVSVDVQVGPLTATLYSHEFSPQPQSFAMCSMADGEMEVKYLSKEDDVGYYTPTEWVKQQIKEMYG